MPDEDQPSDIPSGPDADHEGALAADRLERALERIAAAAQPGGWTTGDTVHASGESADGSAELARRLDAVIATLRAALEKREASA